MGVIVDADDVIILNHEVLPLAHVLGGVGLNLVHFCQLSKVLNELISSARLLRLEETEPEDLCVDTRAQLLADLLRQIVVHDVFEVYGVELVGPWVQDLETLVVHVLGSESLDVFLDELEVGLVRLDRIAQIILVNGLLVVTKERANGLDARCALQVLRCEQLIKVLFKRLPGGRSIHLERREDAHEHLLESLEVPVLVDDGVDDA